MEEKVLIKSEQYNVKKGFKRIVLIALTLAIIAIAVFSTLNIISLYDEYDSYYEVYIEHKSAGTCGNGYYYSGGKHCWQCEKIISCPNGTNYALMRGIIPALTIGAIIFAGIVLIGGLVCLCFVGFELTVTDKRIFGRARKKRVDLPLDSVSAVSTGSFKSIAVASSSGRISFSMIKNRNEIHKVVSDLLVSRQNKGATPEVTKVESSNADELKKYKELLDSGVITQEEFDAKKKQLLGL